MKDMTASIFNIQRYSVNDGPGIRTVVFFKGDVLCNVAGALTQNLKIVQLKLPGTGLNV